MGKIKALAVFSASAIFLTACGNSETENTVVENEQSSAVVTQEPGLEQLDDQTIKELSKIGSAEDEEEIDWDNVHLNKRQFKEFIEALADSFSDENENEEGIDILSSTVSNDKKIEFTIKNADTSDFNEFTSRFFAIFIDTFSRQLYLNSDYYDGSSQPTIIVKDDNDTVISESSDFIELEDDN